MVDRQIQKSYLYLRGHYIPRPAYYPYYYIPPPPSPLSPPKLCTMAHHPSSTSVQIYSCALTGLSPLSDPVVTPSGYICSRKLLLTKLAENGGVDPFDDKGVRRLDESALIDLALAAGGGAAAVIPPRAPKSTSLPHLLTLLQSEFDAVLLELYDTRHALEETRKELSSALYQNDAAIRVVARLAAERDESRNMLERYLKEGGGGMKQPEAASEGAAVQKRAREDSNEEDEDMPAQKKAAKVSTTAEESADVSDLTKIPPSELDAMSTTWKELTASRRAIAKLKRTPMEISKNEDVLSNLAKDGEESKKVNLGKASARAGVLCMTTLRTGEKNEDGTTEYLITGGHDKNAIVYNVSSGTIVATLSGASGDIVTVHGKEVTEGGSIHIVTGSADGHVRLYELLSDGKKKEIMTSTLLGSAKLEAGVPVNVILHPSSTNVDARILVASSNGRVELYKWSSNSNHEEDTLKLVTRLESSPKEGGEGNNGVIEYTSGCMHPDGFIYIAGNSDGSLIVWDLKSQAVAGTLKVSSRQCCVSVASYCLMNSIIIC